MRKSGKWSWLAGAVLAATGCLGPFNLTDQLHHWNSNVCDPNTTGGKWCNEGIFLVCNIIPVYGVCILGDAIIFNSVEFWTGKNWVAAPGA